MDEGAESQTVSEGGGHVGDGHIPVTLALDPAPLLQSFHGRHPGAQTDELVPEPSESAPAAGAEILHLPPSLPPPTNFTNFPQKLGPAGCGEMTRSRSVWESPRIA